MGKATVRGNQSSIGHSCGYVLPSARTHPRTNSFSYAGSQLRFAQLLTPRVFYPSKFFARAAALVGIADPIAPHALADEPSPALQLPAPFSRLVLPRRR